MRIERDFLGQAEIPDEALYGIHAFRAAQNFPDTTPFHEEWFRALGTVKQACYQTSSSMRIAVLEKYRDDPARAESALQHLNLHDTSVFQALTEAASEVASGAHAGSFIVPAFSGGAGTSINMNMNEILANRALQLLGEKAGNHSRIDPVEHANIFQSTNDVIPTSLRIAAMRLLGELESCINDLRMSVEETEKKHHASLRIGYTQMQEAVPTSFGKLFSSYSEALSRDWWRVSKCFERIKQVNLGGGAAGTGLAVPRFFIMEVVTRLQQLTGLPVTRSENLPDSTSNLDSLVEVHAIMKAHAVNLEKMVSDLRILASDLVNPSAGGPTASQRLLRIPAVQVGSSIMPGKVNPVIPEFVISAAHRVYANDQMITSLCAQGCLELNAYLPAIGHALLDSLKLMIAADRTLKANLFDGLSVNPEAGTGRLMHSPSITTALVPVIGYHRASALAQRMKETGEDIIQANDNLRMVESETLHDLLSPENLLKLGFKLIDTETR